MQKFALKTTHIHPTSHKNKNVFRINGKPIHTRAINRVELEELCIYYLYYRKYDWESTPSLLTTIVSIAVQNDMRKLTPDDNQLQKGNDENSTVKNIPSTKKDDKDDQVDSPKRNTLNLMILVLLVAINTGKCRLLLLLLLSVVVTTIDVIWEKLGPSIPH